MADRATLVAEVRDRLADGGRSVGSWMQIPRVSIAEITGAGGYDWVAVDLEHGWSMAIRFEWCPLRTGRRLSTRRRA